MDRKIVLLKEYQHPLLQRFLYYIDNSVENEPKNYDINNELKLNLVQSIENQNNQPTQPNQNRTQRNLRDMSRKKTEDIIIFSNELNNEIEKNLKFSNQ